MPDILDVIAGAYPDKHAVVHGETALTYSALNRMANALSRGLSGLGLVEGDRAVWVGPNHWKVVLWGNAARKTQLVSIPLSYRFTPEEMAYVIDNSDSVLVFCDPDYRPTIETLDLPKVRHIVDYDQADELVAANSGEPLPEGPEGLGASMIYTSGTTGQPKGALRHGADLALVGALIGELGLSSDDVHITTGPMYHSGPAFAAGLTQLLGGTVHILPKFDPIEWLTLVDRYRVSTTFTAPTQMKRLVSVPAEVRRRYDTSGLRVVIANAAPVPYSLKVQWVEAFGEGHLFEVYGSTELGVDTILRPEDQLRKPGSCGKPYANVEIRLLRDDGTEADVGEPGEMWIRSTGAFEEYYKAPDKTEAGKLRDDPEWRTVGDIAYRDDEGYFYVCDRRSDMIISGGMNIYPAEIEAVLHAHPAVMDVAVFGIPSEEWGEQVHAVVQLKEGASADADALLEVCRAHLAGYKRPRSLEFRETLPRTESGKLLKRTLRDEFWKDRDAKV